MPDRPPPSHPDLVRRRLLVALGFGATNSALIWGLGSGAVSGDAATPDVFGGGRPTGNNRSPFPEAVPVDDTLAEPPALADAGEEPGPDHVFQLAIVGGRVIDPISGFDGPLDVGIDDGVITAIRPNITQATTTVDAAGHVVSPGFIDILSAEPNNFGIWFKVADGVTTNLAMHGVNNYASAFFRNFEGKTPTHFGGAFHQHFLRGEDLGASPDRELDAAQLDTFEELARKNIGNGFAGVCFSPEYSPATTAEEIDRLARVAAEFGHVAFFHARHSDPLPPGTSAEAVAEIIELGRRTGVPVHIEHLHSTGGTFTMQETLETIEAARADGVDVTACVYPYAYWATTLLSFRFVGDWQERYRISYEDLQVAGTEQRLTEATFGAAKAENKLVAALGSIPEEELQMALRKPWIMMGSDGILTPSLNHHPRAAGSCARLLGHYVRETGLLDLPSALAKLTSLPAQRMQGMIPELARKGRMQRGADADVVVFDPATINDHATVARPDVPSAGVQHVFVDGVAVLTDGVTRRGSLPGRALRSA